MSSIPPIIAAGEGDLAGGVPADAFADDEELQPGTGPWRLAARRLRRNRVALFFGGLFLVILLMCLLAPVYSNDIAHVGQATTNVTGTITVNGKTTDVVSPIGIPIGPTWNFSHYFLGADALGRDVAVRLLYGGRTSLEIGAAATLLTMVLAIIVGIVAGFFRGVVDLVVNLALDIIWAYPVILLGIAIGTVLAVDGIGPLKSTNNFVVAGVIGFVYIPYVAKPIRAQVLSLREREFIDAARQQGLSDMRIMFTEILPNLSSTIVVFIPLILANAILLEASLTFLGAGVKPPNASWGTMISDGIGLIPAAFHLVLAPGIMLVLSVLSINVFGDGLRDALDPRAKVRIAR
ncbi:MAG: ABC transporter permease [Solirubrobacteraceae bacterium]|jgi:peptide/nickel transport system permease protein